MTFRDLEREIWHEAQRVLENPKLRLKDINDWSTARIVGMPHENVAELPGCGVFVAVSIKHDKRVKG